LHHLIVRGIERQEIFKDDADRNSFVDRLGLVSRDTPIDCFAWALMSNHVHLLIRSGLALISPVMQRLLTGYAIRFNRRHHRHGHLFQNRYKSILCQEDPYFLELVRYIHLNPLRAKLVPDYKSLESYAYCGHCILLGQRRNDWQNTHAVLVRFGKSIPQARRHYREFVKNGIKAGKKPELVGGGLIRSLGGWSVVKSLGSMSERIKGDERILGDGSFVEEVLKVSQERLERRYGYHSKGYDFNWLIDRVAERLHVNRDKVTRPGRTPDTV
jgi:putative transposase